MFLPYIAYCISMYVYTFQEIAALVSKFPSSVVVVKSFDMTQHWTLILSRPIGRMNSSTGLWRSKLSPFGYISKITRRKKGK